MNINEKCNCDQALKLEKDLMIAIAFGCVAEKEIDKLLELIKGLLNIIEEEEIELSKNFQEKFNIESIQKEDNKSFH